MRLGSISAILIVLAGACSSPERGAGDTSAATASSASPAANASARGTGCLVGTWTQPSPSYSPSFTFNADGTGQEVQSKGSGGGTVRFNWAAKGTDKVAITYVAEGNTQSASYDMPINCENGTFGNMYKK